MRRASPMVAVLFALASCRDASVAGPVPTPVPPPTSPRSVVGWPKPQGPCDAVAAEQRHRIERALAANEEADASTRGQFRADGLRAPLTAVATRCHPTARGVWAIVLESLDPPPWDEWQGVHARLSLVHISNDGDRASVVPGIDADDISARPAAYNFYFSTVDRSDIAEATLFDYDGDGEEEILLRLTGSYHEGKSWSRGKVWTRRGPEGVRLYEPARDVDFTAVDDVDGDGRPDLRTFGPYVGELDECCAGFTHSLHGPDLVVHARSDGTFSGADDVAARAARSACPRPPSVVIAPSDVWDEAVLAARVPCARLWGVPETAIVAGLARATRPGATGCEASTCTHRGQVTAVMKAWAKAVPPVALGPTSAQPRDAGARD